MRDYIALTKPRITWLILMSTGVGYFFGVKREFFNSAVLEAAFRARPGPDWILLLHTLIGTGLIASAGYMLLNTRTGFWLLSLMASRPLWKQFDPLEILYSWEEESMERETKEETLLSLVD